MRPLPLPTCPDAVQLLVEPRSCRPACRSSRPEGAAWWLQGWRSSIVPPSFSVWRGSSRRLGHFIYPFAHAFRSEHTGKTMAPHCPVRFPRAVPSSRQRRGIAFEAAPKLSVFPTCAAPADSVAVQSFACMHACMHFAAIALVAVWSNFLWLPGGIRVAPTCNRSMRPCLHCASHLSCLQHQHVQPLQHVVQHVVQNGVHCVVHVAVLVRVPHRSDGAPKTCRVGPCNARVARPCLCRAPGHGVGNCLARRVVHYPTS